MSDNEPDRINDLQEAWDSLNRAINILLIPGIKNGLDVQSLPVDQRKLVRGLCAEEDRLREILMDIVQQQPEGTFDVLMNKLMKSKRA